jgi:hypothetical protein
LGVLAPVLPQNEVYRITLPQNEVDRSVLPQNGVLCVEFLQKKKVPTLALANGLWVGNIPDELQNLTYAEQLLIARVRHNRCIVKVSSGMSKMCANAISFSNPMPKIYNILPPPIEEMDEVLAFIYTGRDVQGFWV